MRLFLASQDLGNHAHVLQEMVGEKRHAFVISNARDYYNDEERVASSVEKIIANLDKIGIKAERLDLRSYFGKQAELEKLIKEKDTGLIFSIGGNVICLSTALHASGLDEIIRKSMPEDRFVYGGYSAGSMVTANDLSLYQYKVQTNTERLSYNIPDVTREIYQLAPYKQGLGLIQQYIIPHMDRPDHIDTMRKRITQIEEAGEKTIRLNDTDVFVVNGNSTHVMGGGV